MNLVNKALAVLALLGSFEGSAQKIGTLRGSVRDAETGEELPGAGVSIVGTYYSTVTDAQGGFVLPKVPVGEFSVKVQMMGYGTKQINGVRIQLGQTTSLTVKLSSDINELQTVTVVGKKTAVDLERAGSERLIGIDELRQMNVRNVEDAVATQAGVVKTTDGLQIRGARFTKPSTWSTESAPRIPWRARALASTCSPLRYRAFRSPPVEQVPNLAVDPAAW